MTQFSPTKIIWSLSWKALYTVGSLLRVARILQNPATQPGKPSNHNDRIDHSNMQTCVHTETANSPYANMNIASLIYRRIKNCPITRYQEGWSHYMKSCALSCIPTFEEQHPKSIKKVQFHAVYRVIPQVNQV